MENAQEALEWLTALADEYLTSEANDNEMDIKRLEHAHQLLAAAVIQPEADALAAAIKELMLLIESGLGYYKSLYDSFSVKLRISNEPSEKPMLAVALSETAGATSVLGAILAHVLSDEAKKTTPIPEIFTGEGLTYPKIRNHGGRLHLPK